MFQVMGVSEAQAHSPKGNPQGNTAVFESGSFQSHLSAANSQQRLRTNISSGLIEPEHGLLPSESNHVHRGKQFVSFLEYLAPPLTAFPAAHSRHARSRSWSSFGLKWAAATYAFLSLVILSVKVYEKLNITRPNQNPGKPQPPCPYPRSPIPGAADTSQSLVFDGLPINGPISRILPLEPPTLGFDPFVLRWNASDTAGAEAVTACLWSADVDLLEHLQQWSIRWPGPISLLVTTGAAPASPEYGALLKRLQVLKQIRTLGGLSMHVLHIRHPSQLEASPNRFLNVARLFAQTFVVMLFPAEISILPPPDMYSAVHSTIHQGLDRPLILTPNNQSDFPFPPFSPVVLPQSYPTWCTERFFLDHNRPADWDECLWQLWLESFGKLGKINTASVLSPLHQELRPRYQARRVQSAHPFDLMFLLDQIACPHQHQISRGSLWSNCKAVGRNRRKFTEMEKENSVAE
ncbi:hypothetical protein BD779DRAFT_1797911 [Infundibulicybe gibba]|nr:hypothetical protein BD779DRAFT_1797911 [Infundibulicybe gibba]